LPISKPELILQMMMFGPRTMRKWLKRIDTVIAGLQKLQDSYSFGKFLSNGLRLAIVGKPNVGKSSLFNRLVGSDRAIVTAIPGTTRDVLSESVNFNGIPLQFLDTAGIRDTVDPIEQMGVARSHETLADADLILFVLDGAAGVDDLDRKDTDSNPEFETHCRGQ
jgi:tRNA modification GTPase